MPLDGQISRQLEGPLTVYLDQALDLESGDLEPNPALPLTCLGLWIKSCPSLGLGFLIYKMGLTRPP